MGGRAGSLAHASFDAEGIGDVLRPGDGIGLGNRLAAALPVTRSVVPDSRSGQVQRLVGQQALKR